MATLKISYTALRMMPCPMWLRCLLLCLVVTTAACEEPPTREMNQAQGALDAARAAGAPEYAADEFRAADSALARSREAVDQKDYRQALNFALDARDRAQTAARQAADEKARLRTEADRAIREVEILVERTKDRLTEAETAGITAAALSHARTAVSAAEQSVAAVRATFDKGEYRQALAALSDPTNHLTGAGSEIDAALAARAARKPTRRNR